MQFANPIFLWALMGLSIPIGIHLLSRKEGKVIKLGSLRHVQETSTQQFRGIRLNEILLLILRCLLIAIFTLILSGLHLNSFRKLKWVLVENGLESQSPLTPVLDSLAEDGYEIRRLSENFPLLNDSAGSSRSTNYRTLLEKLETENLAEAIVFAQNKPTNFKGPRQKLPANVRWISQPLEPLDYTLRNIQINSDSLEIKKGHTSADGTYFTSEKTRMSASNDTESLDTISVTIVKDEDYSYDFDIMKAALTTISKSFPIKIEVEEKDVNDGKTIDSDWCIWLSDEDISRNDSTKILYVKPTRDLELFIPARKNEWIITKRLNEDVALNQNLTLKLASLLIPSKALQQKANSKDRRLISDSIAWSTNESNDKNIMRGSITQSANTFLIVLLLTLLLIERLIAYQRNQ